MVLVNEQLEELVRELTSQVSDLKAERETAQADKTAIDAEIKELKEFKAKVEAKKEEGEKLLIPGLEMAKTPHDTDRFSFTRALYLSLDNKDKSTLERDIPDIEKRCDLERQVCNEIIKRGGDYIPPAMRRKLGGLIERAVSGLTDSSGAVLIPLEMMPGLIPELTANQISGQLGMTRLDGLVGEITWVRDKGGILAYYVDTEAETAITESQSTYSTVTVKPHVIGTLVRLTWSMINQTALGMEAYVRGRIALHMGLLEDKSVFVGSPAAGEPRGMINVANRNTFDWETFTYTTDNGIVYGDTADKQNVSRGLRKMRLELEKDDIIIDDSLGLATIPEGKEAIFSTLDADGHEIFISSNGIENDRVVGWRIRASTQIGTGTSTDERLLGAKFSEGINAHFGPMAMATSDSHDTDFAKGVIAVRGLSAHDCVWEHDEAIVEATNFNLVTEGQE